MLVLSTGYDLRLYLFFFFSSRRRHTRSLRDWSSDVCSSDLLALLAGVAVLIALGKSDLLGLATTIEPWLATLRDNGWAFPATVLVFIATSFVGAPAFMLNAACVLAFGPVMGSIYAMAGTVAACTLHFWIGRWGGPKLMQRYGGDTVNRMARFIGKNDFMASAIVRSVPTAPPIVVNLAFGASRA